MSIIKQYTERGWAIFPCRGKIPLTPNGFKDAVKTPGCAATLFAAHPGANIGIATGEASGFFVLDIDVKNGAGGMESLEALVAEHGALPHTVEAVTWSGGRHYLFKHVAGIGNRTKVRPGIDVRGTGGYIIAPPSTIDGKRYAWDQAHLPSTTEIADAPEWLLALIKAPSAPQAAGTAQPQADEMFTAGSRNDQLMRKGVALRKLGLSAEAILQGLGELNRQRCRPPLPDDEVATIAKSVSRYEPEKKKPVNFSREPLTDVYNARIMYQRHGHCIRFCDSLGGWFIWDGTRWVKDTFQIVSLAKATIKAMYAQAAEAGDKDLYRHAERSEAEGKLRAMVNLTRDHEGITMTSDDFDRNTFLVNCTNGILDLETGRMLPHDPAHNITKKVPLAYDPAAKCPAWEKFIDDIFMGNAETIRFVQKAIGYALSGSIAEQCLFILYGVGSNGKSTFLETISKVFGDYSMTTLASTIMEKQNNGIPNDVARLKGARFVNALETDENKRLAESVIKTLTGGDKIVARFLNKEFFEFHATFKIFLATNHKPRITGTDNGIWRRIKYIPFKRVIPPEARDRGLPERLLGEQAGILAWVVKGFALWRAEGLGTCPEVHQATQEYREESDILGDYLADRCIIEPERKVQATALYRDIAEWCKRLGMYHVARTKVAEYLASKNIIRGMETSGAEKGSIFWYGIGLKDAVEFCGREISTEGISSTERPW